MSDETRFEKGLKLLAAATKIKDDAMANRVNEVAIKYILQDLEVQQPNPLTDPDDVILILKGGGIKGIAYVGALQELSTAYKFTWFVGTSAGAITAVMKASGHSEQELLDILKSQDFRKFKDATFLKAISNLIRHRGFYKADTFTKWIQSSLSKKLRIPADVYLVDLPYRCTLYASTVGRTALVFDSFSTGEISAAFATRCSMSIPYIFTPQQHGGQNVYDGGIQNNYPVSHFIEKFNSRNFLGLYLGKEVFAGHQRKSTLCELLSITTESAELEALRRYASQTIVIDPTPISTLQFSLTEEEKTFLLNCGKLAAKKYLRWINNITPSQQDNDEETQHEVLRTQLMKKKEDKQKLDTFCIIAAISISLIIVFYLFQSVPMLLIVLFLLLVLYCFLRRIRCSQIA